MTPCRNVILSKLPREEFAALFPFLETVRLDQRSVLQQAKRPMEHVIFVEAGMVSVRALDSHGILETALVGYRGVRGRIGRVGVQIGDL